MKKKITAICLCVALVAIAVVGATLAYFTDTKTATNTFTMGDVKIKLDETNVNDPDGDRVTSNEYNVYPGAVVTKDPIVHNTGKNGAYIRAIVTVENGMNWLGFYYDKTSTFPQVEAFEKLICNTLGTGWEIVGFKNVMSTQDHPTSDTVVTLKYTGVLKAGDMTSAMFKNVMLPAKMTASDITTRVAQNGVFHIDVVAQAIQADGFTTWENAFAAFDAK